MSRSRPRAIPTMAMRAVMSRQVDDHWLVVTHAPGTLRRLNAWRDGRPLEDASLAAYLAELHDHGRAAASASPSLPSRGPRRASGPASPGEPSPARGDGRHRVLVDLPPARGRRPMADAPSAPERRVQMWRRGPESARGRSVTRNLPATIGRGVFGEHPFSVGGIRGTDLHPRMRFGARRPRRLLLHGPPTDRGEPPAAGLEDLRRRERQRICLLRPNPPEGRASAVKNPRSRMRPAALRHQLRYRRPPPKRRPSGHELTGPAGADAPPQPGVRLTSPSLRGPGGDTPRPSPRKSIRVCVRCGYPAPVRAAHVHDESANICASEKTAGLRLAGRGEKIHEKVCRCGGRVPIREVWRARAMTAAVRRGPGLSETLGTCASSASNETRRS